MDIVLRGLAGLAVAGSALWLLSFWRRYVASQLGITFKTLVGKPWAYGVRPYREHWPFVSFGFYRFLIARGQVLEMILAVLAFVMATRAFSALIKTVGAAAQSQA
jgi:hypothetical protein